MSLFISNDEIADSIAPKILEILQKQLAASVSLNSDGMCQKRQIQEIATEIANVANQMKAFKLDPNNPMIKLVVPSEVNF